MALRLRGLLWRLLSAVRPSSGCLAIAVARPQAPRPQVQMLELAPRRQVQKLELAPRPQVQKLELAPQQQAESTAELEHPLCSSQCPTEMELAPRPQVL